MISPIKQKVAIKTCDEGAMEAIPAPSQAAAIPAAIHTARITSYLNGMLYLPSKFC